MWHLACEIDGRHVGLLDRRDEERCKSWLDHTFGPGNWRLEYDIRHYNERLLVEDRAWPTDLGVLIMEVGQYRYALHPPLRPFPSHRLESTPEVDVTIAPQKAQKTDSTNRSKTLLLL